MKFSIGSHNDRDMTMTINPSFFIVGVLSFIVPYIVWSLKAGLIGISIWLVIFLVAIAYVKHALIKQIDG